MKRRSGSAPIPHRTEVDGRWTVRFVGPSGSGVGLAADIVADVARLAFRRVRRGRTFESQAEGAQVAEVVAVAGCGGSRTPPEREGAALREALVVWAVDGLPSVAQFETTSDVIVVGVDANAVPEWRQRWHPTDRSGMRATQALAHSAEAAGRLARRMPFPLELWRRALALHVPQRIGPDVEARFLSAYADDAPAVRS